MGTRKRFHVCCQPLSRPAADSSPCTGEVGQTPGRKFAFSCARESCLPGSNGGAGAEKICGVEKAVPPSPILTQGRRGGKSTWVISRDNENSLAYFSISKKVPKKLPRRKTILRRVQVSTAKKLRTSCLPCARGGGFASAKPEGLWVQPNGMRKRFHVCCQPLSRPAADSSPYTGEVGQTPGRKFAFSCARESCLPGSNGGAGAEQVCGVEKAVHPSPILTQGRRGGQVYVGDKPGQ